MFRSEMSIMAVLLPALAATVGCKEEPAEIRVKGPRDALESVKMAPKFAPFEKKGDTIKLRASAFDGDGRFMGPADVRWSSSDSSVASVNQTGLVTILSSGTAKIRAESQGYTEQLDGELEVSAAIVDGIRKVEPKGDDVIELPMGETQQFKAEVINDRGEPMPDAKIRWSTTNWAATVTPTGEVEGRAMGTVQVIAENKLGETVTWDAKVTDWAKKKR